MPVPIVSLPVGSRESQAAARQPSGTRSPVVSWANYFESQLAYLQYGEDNGQTLQNEWATNVTLASSLPHAY